MDARCRSGRPCAGIHQSASPTPSGGGFVVQRPAAAAVVVAVEGAPVASSLGAALRLLVGPCPSTKLRAGNDERMKREQT